MGGSGDEICKGLLQAPRHELGKWFVSHKLGECICSTEISKGTTHLEGPGLAPQ